MKILALEEENLHEKIPDALLKDEAKAVWELQKGGMVREIYFTQDTKEAVIVMECESLAEAERVLGGLPLVREGFIRFSIKQLVPYDGYERLFG